MINFSEYLKEKNKENSELHAVIVERERLIARLREARSNRDDEVIDRSKEQLRELQQDVTNEKSPIVVLDSGVGGINIAKAIFQEFPYEEVIAISDNEMVPYGEKGEGEITRRVMAIVKQIKILQPKMLVVACNTIDSVMLTRLETELSSLGTKVIGIIAPSAVAGVKASKTKQIGLLATPRTIESQQYMISMLGYHPKTHLIGLECPNLAIAIENNDNIKQVAKEEIEPLLEMDIDTLILGCTHYSMILPIIKKMFPKVEIVDSSKIIINEVEKELEKFYKGLQ